MASKRRQTCNPRFKLHTKSSSVRVTVSGLMYEDIRSILTGAAVNAYDSLQKAEKARDQAQIAWYKDQIRLIELARKNLETAVDVERVKKHPPPPLTKAVRRAIVECEREERIFIEKFIEKTIARRFQKPASRVEKT